MCQSAFHYFCPPDNCTSFAGSTPVFMASQSAFRYFFGRAFVQNITDHRLPQPASPKTRKLLNITHHMKLVNLLLDFYQI
jgi:hypothetical protein